MRELNVQGATAFCNRLIEEHRWRHETYEKCGLACKSGLSSSDWECFAAILLGERGASRSGRDLEFHEVKSAKLGSPFAYHYYCLGGVAKAEEERDDIGHLFVWYSDDLSVIDVWRASPGTLREVFDKVVDKASEQKQKTPSNTKSVRTQIMPTTVYERAKRLLRIESGKVVFAVDRIDLGACSAARDRTPMTVETDMFEDLEAAA